MLDFIAERNGSDGVAAGAGELVTDAREDVNEGALVLLPPPPLAGNPDPAGDAAGLGVDSKFSFVTGLGAGDSAPAAPAPLAPLPKLELGVDDNGVFAAPPGVLRGVKLKMT